MRYTRRLTHLEQQQAHALGALPIHSIHTIVVQYGSARLQEVRPALPYVGPVAYLVDGCVVSHAAFTEAMNDDTSD